MLAERKEVIPVPCIYILREFRKAKYTEETVCFYHVGVTDMIQQRIKEHSHGYVWPKHNRSSLISGKRRARFKKFDVLWIVATGTLTEARRLSDMLSVVLSTTKDKIVKGEAKFAAKYWIELKEEYDNKYGKIQIQ